MVSPQQVSRVQSMKSGGVAVAVTSDRADLTFDKHKLELAEDFIRLYDANRGAHNPSLWPSLHVVFTKQEVNAAIERIGNHKPGGHDHLRLTLLKFADRQTLKLTCLLPMFHLKFRGDPIPNSWRFILGHPLYKAGDMHNVFNYRIISLMQAIRTAYEQVLYTRLSNVVTTHGLVDPNQGAFLPKRSCEHHAYCLHTGITHNRYDGRDVYVAFVDVRKAFPSVVHSILWARLHQLGIRGKYLNALRVLYLNSIMAIRDSTKQGHRFAYFIRNGRSRDPPYRPYCSFFTSIHSSETSGPPVWASMC